MSDIYTKHLVRLYIGDFDRLKRLRPDEKPNRVIRELLHDYLDKLQQEKQDAGLHS